MLSHSETVASLCDRAQKQCQPLLGFADQCELIYVKACNNKVMCQLPMKFDLNQMYTSDKIVVKHISVKETLLKLDIQPKGQGHNKQHKN